MRSTSLVTSIILVSILLTGCGTSQSLPTPNPPTNTPLLPTATPLLPTSTPNPPTATPLPPVALTTIEDLVGFWERGDRGQIFMEEGLFLRIEAGGYRCRGWFWFEGNQLHIEDYVHYCSTDEVGIYEVQGVPQDYLIIKSISDYSGSRKAHLRGRWQWIGSP